MAFCHVDNTSTHAIVCGVQKYHVKNVDVWNNWMISTDVVYFAFA